MGTLRRPTHLLFLHEALRNELIDRRFDKSGRDAFATSAPLPVVNDRSGVIVDVSAEFVQRARKLLEHQLWRPPRFAVLLAYPIHLVDEVRQRIVGTHDISVPQKPFDP